MDFGLVNAESDTDFEFVIDADDDNTENNDWQAQLPLELWRPPPAVRCHYRLLAG